jgi:starch synthase
MKVLFVASECYPFAKTGGLGDVIGSLPKELRKLKIDARIIMPFYQDIPESYKQEATLLREEEVSVSWRKQYAGLLKGEYDGLPVYFIDNEYYFKRPGLYGFWDEAERFTFFARAVIELLPYLDFTPDIIHCHDWQTGLVSLYLEKRFKTIFTIHNLHYQGTFAQDILDDILGLGEDYLGEDKIGFFHNVSFMKAGINYCDYVTTVSKTYAEEIKTAYYGENLDGLLQEKSSKLSGIVNGIDYKVYNPWQDRHLKARYSPKLLDKKKLNKQALQEACHLAQKDVPIIAMVTRLVEMKGLDLVTHILEELLQRDIQVVLLGTGEDKYEYFFKNIQKKYAEKVSINLCFNQALSHLIYGGADMFLMPSLIEPCGLSQMIALRYGTIPIVRATGGLKDTVFNFDEDTTEGNGFVFENINAHELLFILKKALNLYENQEVWQHLMQNAMTSDCSWRHSAGLYKDLYRKLMLS